MISRHMKSCEKRERALCYKRERDRERQWRKSKRMNSVRNALHLIGKDFELAEFLDNSPAWISDGGKGAEDIIDHADGDTPETRFQLRLKWARKRVRQINARLLEVFDLVIKNGQNRKESIWKMAKSASK